MKRIALAVLVALAPAVALAQALADGEIRKIDKAAGKVMIKHGEIKSIGMAPMTMMFVVKDKAVLDKLAVNDKVKFDVKQEGGDYVVTKIEKAK
ncbi:MAG TPA: copper-binding protein [Usitatibacteraceae bacterium]|jgi:Cu(I)/Ag(I) efflux system protein CusF|nr:copper-binding protein [Usitatibacteraceae bacterium]